MLKRTKAVCSPSYGDYKLKTNAAILCDMGHTKRRPRTGGIDNGRKPKP
jgi:hypothetical protein